MGRKPIVVTDTLGLLLTMQLPGQNPASQHGQAWHRPIPGGPEVQAAAWTDQLPAGVKYRRGLSISMVVSCASVTPARRSAGSTMSCRWV